MKLTCLQENLNLGLQTTGHLVNKNINLPILNNVLVEAKKEGVRLSSTNLEIGISCQVRCKVEAEGAFTVDAKLLSEYVSLLPNDQIKMELVKDDFLKINCRSAETKIKGIAADDFPVIPKIDREAGFKVKTKDFKKAISQVIFSVSSSETRPEISGVLLNFNKIEPGQLFLVGTDSYRLTEKKIDLTGSPEERDVIVPAKTLQEVLRVLSNMKEQSSAPEEMEIYLSENQILFTCDSIELISRLVDGQYPDYKQIIPKEAKTTVVASTNELVKTIKTVALFSKTGIFDISLVFDPSKGIIARAVNAQVGESTAELEVSYVGEVNETVLNYRYLLDGLSNIDTEEVEISLVDNNIPCSVRPKASKDYLYIVMPIKQ